MTELKPCPFCGGEAEKLTSTDGFTSIGCLSCNPIFGVMIQRSSEAEAIAAWNTRADYHGYEQAAIEAWESIKAWNTRHEDTCRMEPLNAFYTDLNGLNQTEWGVCSNCGTASPIDATYCCECGRKVER